MGKFSQRHYESIAEALGAEEAEWAVIQALAKLFKADNERFKPNLFFKRVAELGGQVPAEALRR